MTPAQAGSGEDIAAVAARLARELPEAHLRAWTHLLDALPCPTRDLESRLIGAHPGAELASRAALLARAWQAAPKVPGAAVALALRAAAEQYTYCRDTHDIELAVSGPTSDAVPVRLTASVAVDVIRSARFSLLIVSYAAFGVREIVAELGDALDRGVRADLVLETTRSRGGSLERGPDPRAAFGDLTGDLRFWHWPAEHRAGPAALQAKILAADQRIALLGSANLTDRALQVNIEVGVVLHDPEKVSRLTRHFGALMRPGAGPLVPMVD